MKRRRENMSQGYGARLDESLGERHRGPHKQSMVSRRHESEGMERRTGHEFAGDRSMDKGLRHKLAAAHHRTLADHYDGRSKKK